MSYEVPILVSIVLVNFRGTDDTITAIEHLRACDWSHDHLEIVVVENGSGDDSAARLQEVEGIVLVLSSENLGFAGGCNLGVSRSRGGVIGFLNNDARPDRSWISAAMTVFAADLGVGAVASRVLDWEGQRVDYIGSAMTWYGMGYKPFTGETIPVGHADERDVLFGTGSAMFVRRDLYDRLGGFDDRYFMFFEDVDLGWRINLVGSRVRYVPSSLAFHRHHASMAGHGAHKEQTLLERNALFTMFKNLDDDTLAEALPAAMALSVRRAMVENGMDPECFDLRRADDSEHSMSVPKGAIVPLLAIDQFTDELPSLVAARETVQAARVVSDAALWRLFERADAPVRQEQRYLAGYENIVTAFPVTERPILQKVVVITGDPIGVKLAGPAIRAWNIAEALRGHADVTLVSLSKVEPSVSAAFSIAHVAPGDERRMSRLVDKADVIVFQGHALAAFACIRASSAIIVADIYDPMHLEQLEQSRELGDDLWRVQVDEAMSVMNEQMERADYFICASERQRHFYLGQLAALGRLTIDQYRDDPDLRGLIDVVPFGLSPIAPQHRRSVIKGVRPGIPKSAKLVLWSGGLYNWFDPHTLIRAVAQLRERRPGVHLFFQGTRHPHPGVPEMEIVRTSRELAAQLGVLEEGVHFNDSWVDFSERENFLTEADVGVSTHRVHLETAFSFRTRILDYLWADLPMVVTRGDHFAELIEAEGLGIVVDDNDPAALAAALERVLFDEEFAQEARQRIRQVKRRFEWDTVLEPLVDFIGRVGDQRSSQRGSTRRRPDRLRRSGLRHDAELVLQHLRASGPRVVARKVAGRLRRRFSSGR